MDKFYDYLSSRDRIDQSGGAVFRVTDNRSIPLMGALLELTKTLPYGFDPAGEARHIYEQMLLLPKADLEKNKSHVLLELAGERTQDIYNANELNDILGKTVITRTFEEVTGKEIRRIHQVPLLFTPEGRSVYDIVMKEFDRVQREYFASTGNSRKDAMLKLMQQITLMLRMVAVPNTLKGYSGDTPLKIMAVEMAAQWEQETVAIGVRHQNVLNA